MNDLINTTTYEIAKQQQQSLQEQAEAERQARAAAPAQSGLRQRAGQALIDLGQRIQGAPQSGELPSPLVPLH